MRNNVLHEIESCLRVGVFEEPLVVFAGEEHEGEDSAGEVGRGEICELVEWEVWAEVAGAAVLGSPEGVFEDEVEAVEDTGLLVLVD
jgi:hypothetical protein